MQTKPPGSAQHPWYGGMPRRTSSTLSASARTVSITRSTVTAKGGTRPSLITTLTRT